MTLPKVLVCIAAIVVVIARLFFTVRTVVEEILAAHCVSNLFRTSRYQVLRGIGWKKAKKSRSLPECHIYMPISCI